MENTPWCTGHCVNLWSHRPIVHGRAKFLSRPNQCLLRSADTRLQCWPENAMLHRCKTPVAAMLRVKPNRIKLRGIVRRDVPNRQRCAGQVYQAYSASIFAPSSRNLGAGSGALSFYENLDVQAGSCLAAEWLNARAFLMRSDRWGALLRINH
jgi:hypothetical protein